MDTALASIDSEDEDEPEKEDGKVDEEEGFEATWARSLLRLRTTFARGNGEGAIEEEEDEDNDVEVLAADGEEDDEDDDENTSLCAENSEASLQPSAPENADTDGTRGDGNTPFGKDPRRSSRYRIFPDAGG